MSPRFPIAVCVLALLAFACGLRAAPVYDVLATFDRGPAYPKEGRLAQTANGTFYGVLRYSGTEGRGSIYKVTAAGAPSIVGNFTNASGAFPGSDAAAGMIVGSDGNLYGTSRYGGANYLGSVFKLTPAGVFTTLVSFTGTGGAAKGSLPQAELLVGSDGNFYGTTYSGGAGDFGTIFKLTPAGVLTTLAEFTGPTGAVPGANPLGVLVRGTDGNYYGTTSGSSYGSSTVFKVTPAGVCTSLALLTGTPSGELALGNDGNFYGTTQSGGNGYGTVFKMTPAGLLTRLAAFTGTGGGATGSYPNGLVRGSDGAFYGTTFRGGASDLGTVFKVTTAGVFTTLTQMTSASGAVPVTGLIVGSDGALYGTANQGGASDHGVIFRITIAGSYSTVVQFTGTVDPSKPLAPNGGLTRGADGAFYGTSVEGGTSGFGTVFKITPAGALTTLVHFTGPGGAAKGSVPETAPLLASDGNFYGTTSTGGVGGFGTVFKMTPAGALTTLAEFTGTAGAVKGQGPSGQLIQGLDGALYGTTYQGGGGDNGTIFKITTAGVFTTLFEFSSVSSAPSGNSPTGGLTMDSAGDFYGFGHWGGTNSFGTIFKVTPAGVLTPLVQFTGTIGAAKGSYPESVSVAGDGAIYGATENGGAGDYGTVFRMTPAGVLTTLTEFTGTSGAARGKRPYGGLRPGSDGALYGTTNDGAALGYGSIYKVTPDGVFTTLVDWSGSTGPAPGSGSRHGAPLLAPDGNLYGSAFYGGGVLWRVSALDHTAVVLTQPAAGLTATSATLAGTVTANGAAATVVFEYGLAPALGSTLAATPSPVTGSTATAVSALLTGLAPHTTFYFRTRATSSGGIVAGNTLSFTTPTTYATWAVEQFGAQSGDPAIAGPDANPDRDALVNLLEYALGTAPGIGGDAPPEVALTAGHLTLTYTRPKDRSDLAFIVEVAPAPDQMWLSGLIEEVARTDHGATETVQVRSTTPAGTVPGQVIRLRVVRSP